MQSPAISILIPVYNTAAYIERCLHSIFSQSFADFEIVAVDDGSTDNSLEVLARLAKQDKRLHIYHKENGGVSSARNLAIDHARGDWYMFIDSDDELTTNALSVMYQTSPNTMCDMVVGSYVVAKESGARIHADLFPAATEWTQDDVIEAFFSANPGKFQGYIWNRLFRASIIQKYNLRFDTSIVYKEDGLFLIQYLLRSNHAVSVTPDEVYIYHDRSDSAMGQLQNGFVPAHITNLYARVKILNEIKHYSGNPKHITLAKRAVNQIARVLRHQMISGRHYHPKAWFCIFKELVRSGALFSTPNE